MACVAQEGMCNSYQFCEFCVQMEAFLGEFRREDDCERNLKMIAMLQCLQNRVVENCMQMTYVVPV